MWTGYEMQWIFGKNSQKVSNGKRIEPSQKTRSGQMKVSHHGNLEVNLSRCHEIKAFYDLGH